MLTVWRLVEALPRFVDRFWFTFYLDPERSSDDVDDDGKRMSVWCREPAGRIGNFNQTSLEAGRRPSWAIPGLRRSGIVLSCHACYQRGFEPRQVGRRSRRRQPKP